MPRARVGSRLKTSVVSAFTFAAALIWRDTLMEIIELVVPPAEELLFKIAAAVIATAIVLVAIYLVLETEHEAEIVIRKIKKKKGGKKAQAAQNQAR